MHYSDKSLAYKKNAPSISYYSNYNNINSSFDLSSKPVIKYSNENTSRSNKASNLENKSFTSSSMSSSSSSTSSAYQSDNNNNNYNSVSKLIKPNSVSPPDIKYLNNNNNNNSNNHLHYESTENQINRILNDLKTCSDSCPNDQELKKHSFSKFNVNNLNRLSSYDNHDVQDYLDNTNNNNIASHLNIIDEQVNNQHLNLNEFNNSLLMSTNGVNGGIYSKKRASIAGPVTNSTTVDTNKPKSKTSNSTTTINSDMYGSNSRVGNLFSRAFSLAPKKNNSSVSSSQKETWKSKLGKYLPHHSSNSNGQLNGHKSKKNSLNDEGCDIMIDEDLYSSYHLTRRNPISRESIATLTLEKARINQMNLQNESNKKLSSISNSSVDLGATATTTASQHSSSLSSSQVKEASSKSSRVNLDHEENNSFSNKTGQQFKTNRNEKLKSESKPNLANNNKENSSTSSQPFSANFTNSLNKLIVNNGFNSLRKILKFPVHKSQNLNEMFDESKNANPNKCFSPQVAHSATTNKTLSSSSFNANNKANLNTLKNSQVSLIKSNEIAKNTIKLNDSPSSSSVSRSSSIIASGSSLSTPSSILPNSKSNSNTNVPTSSQTQAQTLASRSNQKNNSNLKKQHSFSSATNAYHFSMFGSPTSESMKKNALQSQSTAVGLNRQHEHIKSLNNLPNSSLQSRESSELNRRNSPNKTSKSTPRIDELHKNVNASAKESKVKTMFKIYKNVLNKMNKAKSVTSNNTLIRQQTSSSNNKETFNCFNKNNNNTKPGLAKSLLLNSELSCVKNECNFLSGNGDGNASASTLSGIGYFRRASVSSSSETNLDLNQNDNSPIKLYDGHRSLIKQLEMHKLISNYDTNNNIILHNGDIDVNSKNIYENTCHLNTTIDIFSNKNSTNKASKNNFIETNEKVILDANKLVKDSLLTAEEDIMCDREVASFFDAKSKQSIAKEMIQFDQNAQYETTKPSLNLTTTTNTFPEPDIEQSSDDDSEFNESNEDFYEYNSFEEDSNQIELNSQDEEVEDDDSDGNDEEDDDDEEDNLEYLVKQLAAEASLSSVNLNAKLILNNNKKETSPPQIVIKSNYANSLKNTNYNTNHMDLENLVDDLNKNFEKNDEDEEEEGSIDNEYEDENNNNNKNQQFLKLNEENTSNLTDTEIQSILRSSEVSSASFLDEIENNLKLINKQQIAQNDLFSSLKKSQPSSLVKHVSSTIVRPVKQYDQEPPSVGNYNGLKKSFNSTILVQKPLIISPFENYTSSLGRGAAYKTQEDEFVNKNNRKEIDIKNGKMQPLNDINFKNIKIEKKIRLNYRRPQHLTNNNNRNYLNFGTLC